MTALDDRLGALARRVLARTGKPMILITHRPLTYDPETGLVTTNEGQHEIQGLIENYQAHDISDLIKQGDRRVMIAAVTLPVPPEPGDTLQIDGAQFRIITVEAAYSGVRPALFSLQIRR